MSQIKERVGSIDSIHDLEEQMLSRPDEAKYYLDGILEQSRLTGNEMQEGVALCLLGVWHLLQNNYDYAELYSEFALSLSSKHDDSTTRVRAMATLALIEGFRGHHHAAIQRLKETLVYAYELGEGVGLARILVSLAWSTLSLKDHASALKIYKEALFYAEEAHSVRYQAEALAGMAHCLHALEQFDQALDIASDTLKIARQYHISYLICEMRFIQSSLYLKVGLIEKSLSYCERGFMEAYESGYNDYLVQFAWLFGECYMSLADYELARRWLLQGRYVAQNIGNTEFELASLKSLSHLSEIVGNYHESLTYLKEYTALIDEQAKPSPQPRNLPKIKGFSEKENLDDVIKAAWATEGTLKKTPLEMLKEISHDPLTGVFSKEFFWMKVNHELSRLREEDSSVLLYFFIKDLTAINAVYGKATSDALLQEIARRLGHITQPGDSVGRTEMGGFLLYRKDQKEDRLFALEVDKLRQNVSRAFYSVGQRIHPDVAVMYSFAPRSGRTVDELFRNIEAILGQAEGVGGQRVLPYELLHRERQDRHRRMKDELPFALQNNELFLVYQPQYCLMTDRMIGVEALLRWQHQEFGLSSPSEFIPLIEDSDLIVDIGQWVINEACQQAAQWNFPERRMKMAVNISPRELENVAFPAYVEDALRRVGLPGKYLEFELTERVLQYETSQLAEAMSEVSRLGPGFSLDDFGTGVNGLSLLKDVPVRLIKVDKSFITDLTGHEPSESQSATFIKFIVELAHELGLAVTCEGIETPQQREILRALRCDYAQGYGLAQPMSAADLTVYLRSLC